LAPNSRLATGGVGNRSEIFIRVQIFQKQNPKRVRPAMKKNSRNVFARSDRALIAALAIVLATASAAVGSAIANAPHADKKPETRVTPEAVAQAIAAQADATLKASASDQPMTRLLTEHRCLSEVLYYEARGETEEGQKAIAEVVFRRMKTGNYGQSICSVVYEGAKGSVCQFSFTCNGETLKKKAPGAWREAEMLAARILTNEVHIGTLTGGATNFHAISVQPVWADELQRTVQIGNHVFYRSGPRAKDS
jgi:spore germination cell wall hydrolase CwlJ-like protein